MIKRKPLSEEHKRKIGDTLRGRKHPMSEATRLKIAAKNKERKTRYWLGKEFSPEYRQKLSDAHPKGNKSKWFKHGLSKTKSYKALHAHKRRILISESKGVTILEWETLKQRLNFQCLGCYKYEPEITLTIDHIIPISKGGKHEIENIQPLCGSCNSRKGSKLMV